MASNVSRGHIILSMNAQAAKDVLKALEKQAESTKAQLDVLKEAGQVDTKEYRALERELKSVQRAIRENEKDFVNLDEIVQNLATTTRGKLVNALKSAAREMNNMAEGSADLDKLKSQYEQITAQIKKLEVGYVNVEKIMQSLDTASEKTLRKALSQLRDVQSGTERGTQAWIRQEQQMKSIESTLNNMNRMDPNLVMSNLSSASVNDIKGAIAEMERLRNETVLGSSAWNTYNDKMNMAREYLDQFSKQQKMSVDVAKSMASGATPATVGQLKEAAEVLKTFRDTVNSTDAQGLEEVDSSLKKITEQLSNQQKMSVEDAIKIAVGMSPSTIGELKEATNVLKEFRDTLELTDTDTIKAIDDGLKMAADRLNNVQKELIDVAAVLADPKTFSPEKIRKAIAELNDQLNKMTMNDPRREGIRQQIQALNGALDETERQTVDVQQVLNNIKTASLDDLKMAAKQLEEEIGKAARNTDEYAKKSAEYARIKRQLDEVNKSWKEQDSTIARVAKRLAAYVGIYGVFNLIKNQISGAVKDNLALSDSLADISKTTGLTANQVAGLSKEIDGLDTRTLQEDLHDLAFQAGKLGISGAEGILQFVRAGNQLVVALGEDLGGAEAVKNLMKLSDILGLTAKMGVERALLAIGSAINEIGQNSTASEGYMVDFAKRLGGIAAQSKITMAELIGLGGTTDALGQNVEVSATALNKFLVTLQTNTRGVAQASGVTESALKELLGAGKTMDAAMMVFEGLSHRGGLAELAPLMGDLGSDGARLTAVLSSLIGNTEMLKSQLYTSNKAFSEAVSVTNEYNIKNENAAAILARMGNVIRESFVNSGFVGWLTQVLTTISNIPKWLERNYEMLRYLASALIAVTAQLVLGRIELIKYISLMNKSDWAGIGAKILNLGKALFTKTTYVNLSTVAWTKLTAAMKANWFGILLSALAAVVSYFVLFKDKVSAATEAIKDFNSKLQKEKLELDAIFGALEKTNMKTGERASLIQQINNKYGKYLGFMLSEKDSALKLAAAHELINAKLRERIALDMQEAMRQNAIDKYADKAAKAMSKLYDIFSGQRGIGETFASDAMALVQKITGENVNKSVGEINKAVQDGLREQFKGWYSHQQWIEISGEIQKFVDTQKRVQAELSASAAAGKSIVEGSTKDIEKANEKLLNNLNDEFNAYLGKMGSADQTVVEKAKNLAMNTAKQYLEYADKFIKENPTSKYVEWLKAPMAAYNKWIEENTPKKISPWGGENFAIETSSVDQLVKRYKTLFDWRKEIAADKDYTQFADGGFQSREEEMEALMKQLDELKSKLNEMGYNEFGKFLKVNSDKINQAALKAARGQYQAVMSAIEVFYKQQEQVINESYIKRQITAEEAEKQLTDIELNHLKARIEARKKLHGDDSTWDDVLKTLSDYDMAKSENSRKAIENLISKDLKAIGEKLRKFGEAEDDGIWKKLEEDILKMQKIAIDHRAEIDKILLSHDYTGQVTRQYQAQLEKLKLFFIDYSKITKEGYADAQKVAEAGMKALLNISPDLYDLDINTDIGLETFKQMITNSEAFGDRMKELTDEEYQTLYYKTIEYYDATTEAEKKAKDRSLKIAKERWERTQQFKDNELRGAKDKDTLGVYKAYEDIGLASPSMVQDQETLMYMNRLEAAKDFYNYLDAHGHPTEEAMLEIQKAASDLSEKLIESTKERLSRVREFGVSFENFGTAFGESAFVRGEEGLESRQKALENLVRGFGEATKQIILDWVKQQIEHAIIRTAMAQKEEEFREDMADSEKDGTKKQSRSIQNAGRTLLKETAKWGKNRLKAKRSEKIEEEQIEEESQSVQGTIATEGTAAISGALMDMGNQVVQAKKTQAAENISTSATEATANTSLGIASGAAQTIGELGWWGIPLVAVITALLSGLLSAAMGKVSGALGGSKGGGAAINTKLVTGMLTYDSGNVQAVGNDGHTYSATHVDRLSTGLVTSPIATTVGGEPALIAERGPEMIIGRETTKAMMMSRPDLLDAIVKFDKNRSGRTYKAYDAGNVGQFGGHGGMDTNGEESLSLEDAIAAGIEKRMSPILEEVSSLIRENTQVNAGLSDRLNKGITAKISKNGKGGLMDEVISGLYDAKRTGSNDKVKRMLS